MLIILNAKRHYKNWIVLLFIQEVHCVFFFFFVVVVITFSIFIAFVCLLKLFKWRTSDLQKFCCRVLKISVQLQFGHRRWFNTSLSVIISLTIYLSSSFFYLACVLSTAGDEAIRKSRVVLQREKRVRDFLRVALRDAVGVSMATNGVKFLTLGKNYTQDGK